MNIPTLLISFLEKYDLLVYIRKQTIELYNYINFNNVTKLKLITLFLNKYDVTKINELSNHHEIVIS